MFFFFFNDTATTEIYTLSLHDALPISSSPWTTSGRGRRTSARCTWTWIPTRPRRDRKSTRLNSSHSQISYAVFCLKKKNITAIEALQGTPVKATPDTAQRCSRTNDSHY